MTELCVLAVVVLLMSRLMVRFYNGEAYCCPTCGTADPDAHAGDCPWRK